MHAPDIAEYVAETYSADRQRAELADPRAAVFLLEDDVAPIGFIYLVDRAHAEIDVGPDPIEIVRFYVARSHAGRGLGSRLLDAADDEARARARRTMWLSTWQRNADSIAFYERRGFSIVGEQSFRVGSDVQRDWVMARRIP